MDQYIEVGGELKPVEEITLMYSQGNYYPLDTSFQHKMMKAIWENNLAVHIFNRVEAFDSYFKSFKSLFENKMTPYRLLCVLMVAYQSIIETFDQQEDEIDVDVGPVAIWLVDLVKDEIKPTNEIVEMIINKHLEDQAIKLKTKVLTAIEHIEVAIRPHEAFWKKALDVCFHYKTGDRVDGMLDAFSEALQEWYENKLKEGEGDIAGDAEWMKKLYDDVKMIYEATSEKTLLPFQQ